MLDHVENIFNNMPEMLKRLKKASYAERMERFRDEHGHFFREAAEGDLRGSALRWSWRRTGTRRRRRLPRLLQQRRRSALRSGGRSKPGHRRT